MTGELEKAEVSVKGTGEGQNRSPITVLAQPGAESRLPCTCLEQHCKLLQLQ